MDLLTKLIYAIELHSIKDISDCFNKGINPNSFYNGEPIFSELTSQYTRTPRFKDCVRVFVDHGLQFDDKILLHVLLDDAGTVKTLLATYPEAAHKKYTMRCAYTPLFGVSLLHICAEFNHVACASVLVDAGCSINETAGIDEDGFGGQTPIFHTVNQNSNNSIDMMIFLLGHSADCTITVKGFIWGKGYEWETLIPAVNPISYAMMGLLPQMHRDEQTITAVVSRLLSATYGIDAPIRNVPNAYLNKES